MAMVLDLFCVGGVRPYRSMFSSVFLHPGNSKNVVKAAEMARSIGMHTIAFTGKAWQISRTM